MIIFSLCLYKKDATSLIDTENILIRLDRNHNFIDLVDDLENRKLINEPEFKKFFGNEMATNQHANELSASLFEVIVEDAVLIEKNNDRSLL